MAYGTPVMADNTTVAFSSDGCTLRILSIEGLDREIEEVDTTHLGLNADTGANYKTSIPATFVAIPPVTFKCQYTPGTAMPTMGLSQTVTITYADATNSVFTGWLKSRSQAIAVGSLLTIDLVFARSGAISGSAA